MLRDDRQVLLNDLIVANQETAAAYEQTIEIAGDDTSTADACRKLLASCRDIIAALDDCVRALDDLPNDPDPERELLRSAGRTALSALSPRPDWVVLVETLIEHEQKVRDLCAGADDVDLPDTVGRTVANCLQRSERAIHTLKELAEQADP